MNIVIVGGHDCMHCRYEKICQDYGCKCKVFTQCPASFQSRIGKPELIVVFTKTVAHKMLAAAYKQAEKNGVEIRYSNSSSANALQEVLTHYFQGARK